MDHEVCLISRILEISNHEVFIVPRSLEILENWIWIFVALLEILEISRLLSFCILEILEISFLMFLHAGGLACGRRWAAGAGRGSGRAGILEIWQDRFSKMLKAKSIVRSIWGGRAGGRDLGAVRAGGAGCSPSRRRYLVAIVSFCEVQFKIFDFHRIS